MNKVQNITVRYGRYTVSMSNGGRDTSDLREVAVFVEGKKNGLPAEFWHPTSTDQDWSVWVSTEDLIEVLKRVKQLADLELELEMMGNK